MEKSDSKTICLHPLLLQILQFQLPLLKHSVLVLCNLLLHEIPDQSNSRKFLLLPSRPIVYVNERVPMGKMEGVFNYKMRFVNYTSVVPYFFQQKKWVACLLQNPSGMFLTIPKSSSFRLLFTQKAGTTFCHRFWTVLKHKSYLVSNIWIHKFSPSPNQNFIFKNKMSLYIFEDGMATSFYFFWKCQ